MPEGNLAIMLDGRRRGGEAWVRPVPECGVTHFRMGSTIVVGEDEAAVFVVQDHALDTFGPGRHTLHASSIPLLTRLAKLPYGASSSFEATLYHVRTDLRAEQRWGTKFAVAFHDNMLGVVRVRAFGTYGVRVVNVPLILNTMLRLRKRTPLLDVEGTMGEMLSTRLGDFLSERLDTIIDLPRYAREATNSIGLRLATELQRQGLELLGFQVQGLTVPDEVLSKLEARNGVSAVRALYQFFIDQVSASIDVPTARQTPSGEMEWGRPALAVVDPADPTLAQDPSLEKGATDSDAPTRCKACYSMVPSTARFCPVCGDSFQPQNPCLHCGQENVIEAIFCHRCGVSLNQGFVCPTCNAELPLGSRYCMACGNPTGRR